MHYTIRLRVWDRKSYRARPKLQGPGKLLQGLIGNVSSHLKRHKINFV